MRKKLIRMSLLAWSLVLSGGCVAGMTPEEVTEAFWKGVREQDETAISRFVTSASKASLSNRGSPGQLLPIGEVTLGRTVIDQDRAWIDTTVVVQEDRPFHLPLQTTLKQENLEWKVDYDATVSTLRPDSDLGRALGQISILSRQFTDQLHRSLEQAQQALPEIEREIGRVEDQLRRQLPELRQRLDEFMRQLEEALGGHPAPVPATPPPRTREI